MSNCATHSEKHNKEHLPPITISQDGKGYPYLTLKSKAADLCVPEISLATSNALVNLGRETAIW